MNPFRKWRILANESSSLFIAQRRDFLAWKEVCRTNFIDNAINAIKFDISWYRIEMPTDKMSVIMTCRSINDFGDNWLVKSVERRKENASTS